MSHTLIPSITRQIRKALLAMPLAMLLATAVAAPAQAGPPGEARSFEVRITNLTSGQPLSPPVIATHASHGVIFAPGHRARYGLQQVAENGDIKPLQNELAWWRYYGWVHQSAAAMAPLVPAGVPADAMFDQSVTLRISSSRWHDRLSWASMIGCSNDGFTGVDGIRLPRRIGERVATYTYGYDAGTERNSESFADLPGGCQGAIGVMSSTGAAGTNMSNAALWQGGRIRSHEGITGRSSDGLRPRVHGWSGPIASITITAVA